MIALVLSVFLIALSWAAFFFVQLPLGIAVAVTAALALAWIAALAYRRLTAAKAAGDIEGGLHAQARADAASARPDQQPEIEALQAEFNKAVQALKASKLGRSGRDALALLPWYLLIGPPGSGKSTALRASGLKFPYLSKRGGVRGVGGTRNCEWWLTNEAVLLDTAGRYTTEEEDREEWEAFLSLLSRTRPRKPLNGLLVAVPLSDLGAQSEESAAEQGRQIRQRVDEVMSRLKVVLPVYLLLTKCDLLPGFVEFFGDLRKADRGQVWGFTVPLSEGRDRGEAFRERFDELLQAAEERALRRLAEERHIRSRERIYEFPQQLAAVRDPLSSFVEALFAENVYQDAPIFRGAYFISGTQEGRVVDRVMTAMAQAFGIPPAAAEPEPVLEVKSYFLRDVFAKVIIPDQGIAFRSAQAERREKLRRWALAGVGGLALLLFLAFSLGSFLANRELIASTGAIVDAVSGRLSGASRGPPPLAELEPLRERLALLVRYSEEGPPLSMRLGLYRGDELLEGVRKMYGAAVRRLVVDPVFKRDVDEMEEFARRLEASDAQPERAEHARFYQALKLHLFLSAPRGLSEPRIGPEEQGWIGQQVAERWTHRAGADPTAPRLIEENARLFARLLAGDPGLSLPRYEEIVKRERRILGRLSLAALAEERLAAELDGKGYDLNLTAMLGGPSSALRAEGSVRGAYTRRAYEEVLKEKLESKASLPELWVVAGEGKDSDAPAADELERLRSRYFERYIEAWQVFLQGVSVNRAELSALALLQELTRGEPPLFGRLLRGVAYNSRLRGPSAQLGAAAKGVVDKALGARGEGVGREFARLAEAPERRLGPRDVEYAFAGLAEFAVPPEAPPSAAGAGGAAPSPVAALAIYQEQLALVRDALQSSSEGSDSAALVAAVTAARIKVQALIGAQTGSGSPLLRSLLLPPIEAVTSSTRLVASKAAAAKWCSAVALPFRRNVAPRYPFARDGQDAALAEVAEFFRPNSGILWGFYAEALRAQVPRAGDGFQCTRQLGDCPFRPELLGFLKRAQQITAALFTGGAAEPAVAFSVRIRPTKGIAKIFLEVDGQRIEYLNWAEKWHLLTWPKPGRTGASLKAFAADGREETLQREGEWGLFRLLEAGAMKVEPGAHEFAVAFWLPRLGATINIDVRPARSDTPFFDSQNPRFSSLLEPLRRGPPVPLEIAGGGACQ
jgi:type VI secretion system protein ImpL